MKQASDNDELLIKYLLGELSEEEQESVEQRFISDAEYYEQLLSVEDDLIDSYAADELSQARRLSFENHFLRSPDRQSRVGFATAWAAYVSRESKAVRAAAKPARERALFGFLRLDTWPGVLRVAAISVVMLAGAWLTTEVVRLRGRAEQAELQTAELDKKHRELEQQRDEEHRRNQELSAELERERSDRDRQPSGQPPPEQIRSGIIAFLLTPGSSRGTSPGKKHIIPPDAHQVNLQLSFTDDDHQNFLVAVSTVEGREIWRKAGLKAQSTGGGKLVTVQIPATVFATEDYIVTLSGSSGPGSSEKVAEYFFSAAKK